MKSEEKLACGGTHMWLEHIGLVEELDDRLTNQIMRAFKTS